MSVVITNQNIPNVISFVKTMVVSTTERLMRLGVMKARANQAAERFPVTAQTALRNARFVLLITIL